MRYKVYGTIKKRNAVHPYIHFLEITMYTINQPDASLFIMAIPLVFIVIGLLRGLLEKEPEKDTASKIEA